MDWMWAKLTRIAYRSMTLDQYGDWTIKHVQLRSVEEMGVLLWALNLPVGDVQRFRVMYPLLKPAFTPEEFRQAPSTAARMIFLRQEARKDAIEHFFRHVYWNYVMFGVGDTRITVTLTTKDPIAVKNYTSEKRAAIAVQLAVFEHVLTQFEDKHVQDECNFLDDGHSTLRRWTKGASIVAMPKQLTEIENLVLMCDDAVANSNVEESTGHPIYLMLLHALNCIARAAHDCDKTQNRSCHIDDTSLWWCTQALHELRLLGDKDVPEIEAQGEVVMVWAAAIEREK